MLPLVLELWFDFSCPYAYLASRRAHAVARGCGVRLAWKPMLLGGVFRGIGAGDGPMPTLGPAKAAHNVRDMHRWAELFGVPLHIPAAHPMRTVRALRTLLALPEPSWPVAIEQLFAAYWQRGEDITQDSVIAQALRLGQLAEADIASALARADDPAIKAELFRRTDEAIALGLFGAPGWVVRKPDGDHVLAWGQDRIAHVEAILAGWEPDAALPPGGPRPFGTGTQPFTSPSSLDVYFDVASPFAYFALTQLAALARVTGVTPRLHPILLGALFRDIGQVDVPLLSMSEAKRRYTFAELGRWSRWWGVPFAFPRVFPQRTVTAQRLCLLAAEQSSELGIALAIALARAMWGEQRDIAADATLAAILDANGLPASWLARTQEPEVKARLAAHTESARAAGVFGVPTFVVDNEVMIWGQDRLDLVMRALGGWRPVYG
jgi:2-hydroxychromene-2-carboxylate isomerase